MKPTVSGVVSLQLLVSASLSAQAPRAIDPVPLKNWATPLYWQPNQTEREASRQGAAQIQFSPNATSNTALIFVAVSPCRLVDTRGSSAGFIGSTPFNGPYIPAQTTVSFPVQSTTEAQTTAPTPCGTIPSIAQAYSLNVTVVPHPFGTSVNFVTMWPNSPGVTQPTVSTLNDQQGAILANAAIVPAGTTSGGINVYAYGPTDVIIDMNGFYAAPSDLNGNTAIGAGTLLSNTTGSNNTAIGGRALESNTAGTANTATGADALLSNTTGSNNTATGLGALFSNTTGTNNTANGDQALAGNTTGIDNTATGTSALWSNTAGNDNTANGYTALWNNTTGNNNTASGYNTLYNNTTGFNNTASGSGALYSNTTGGGNTASGDEALFSNTTGSLNTATGSEALQYNTTGSLNTATGNAALYSNTIGSQNTASGYAALFTNTTGSYNVASGYYSLFTNTTGTYNTANGLNALYSNTVGYQNTASGSGALLSNTSGFSNEASGTNALNSNTTGYFNTASGAGALVYNTTGINNVAIGSNAAINAPPASSNNIHIGSLGSPTDNGTIRIGNQGGGQTNTFVAGISGVGVASGVSVVVNSGGQLGIATSSRRFKDQIIDMGDSSSRLFQLRPVNYFYKPEYDDGSHLLQYGLIAEEVEKVYPEMVAYGSDGQIMTVKYQMLAPMLLNEVQKQRAEIHNQKEENRKLADRLAAIEAILATQTPTIAQPATAQ